MTLDIITGKKKGPRKTFLYGVPGVGKSSWVAECPGVVFLPTEDRLDDIDVARFPVITSYSEFLERLGQVYSEKHDFKAMAVDTLDWLQTLIERDICREKEVETVGDIGYGKGFELVAGKFAEVREACDAIRRDRGLDIFLIAHAEAKPFDCPEVGRYNTYRPRIHEKAREPFIEWADEVLFACFKTAVKTEDAGFGKKKNRAIGKGDRIMRTTNRPTATAKNCLGLPEEIELNFGVYSEYRNK